MRVRIVRVIMKHPKARQRSDSLFQFNFNLSHKGLSSQVLVSERALSCPEAHAF